MARDANASGDSDRSGSASSHAELGRGEPGAQPVGLGLVGAERSLHLARAEDGGAVGDAARLGRHVSAIAETSSPLLEN